MLNADTVQHPFSSDDYIKKFTYVDGQVAYEGRARPGTAAAAPGWQIRKYTYAETQVTDIQFAGGDHDYVHVWDDGAGVNYATYQYS
jgi:hypothetical protein